MTLHVHIITPEKALPVMEADHVTVPGTEGEAGIRTGHAPYVTLLRNGKVFIKSQHRADVIYAVRGGVAQVFKDEVKILTEAISDPGQVTEADLLRRLNKILDSAYDDPLEQLKAKAEAQWIVTQLKTAGKDVPEVSKLGL